MKRPVFLAAIICMASCNNPPADKNTPDTRRDVRGWEPPQTGVTVAADSMKTNDPLNAFYFAVKLTVSADNEGATGDYGFVYDIVTHYGPGGMVGKLIMPAGGKSLKPLLQRDPQGGYRYIIGFIAGKELGGDGKTFQEFYSVTGSKETVEIKPLKSYRFH